MVAYIPSGYCQCGCGNRTEVYREANRAKGRIKGEPRPYLQGHHNRPNGPDAEGEIQLRENGPLVKESLVRHFWSKVEVRGEHECWPFQGYVTAHGRAGLRYGRMRVDERGAMTAHRVAYQLTNGVLPANIMVCHACDNGPCCNPTHLFAGTGKDNADDRDGKGRYVHPRTRTGEKHPSAKLKAWQVRAIRRAVEEADLSHRQLSKAFGVTPEAIRAIVRRATWKDVA